MEKYQKKISESINSSYPELDVIFTTPPDSRLGDISMPCFAFAKILRKSPNVIADELKSKLINLDFIEKIESTNGYLYFFIKKDILFKDVPD
ncbi:MAG: hypothetical protein GXX10_06445 [Clostridiaceae bacterium]|nr:hypothetical protein [Clostridiaceae bacterium]